MTRVGARWLLLVCLVVGVSRPASASSIVIGNLPFDGSGGTNTLIVSQPLFAAAGFTLGSQDVDLVSATLYLAPQNGTVSVVLSSTTDPFTPLVSLTGSLSTTPSSTLGEYTFTPTSPFTLLANTTYYLVYSPIGGDVDWLGDTGDTPTGLYATNAGFSLDTVGLGGYTFDYQIEGDLVDVPEPSVLALIGVGALTAVRNRRRQRRSSTS